MYSLTVCLVQNNLHAPSAQYLAVFLFKKMWNFQLLSDAKLGTAFLILCVD